MDGVVGNVWLSLNMGDLIGAAHHMTPESTAFMVCYTSGLVRA